MARFEDRPLEGTAGRVDDNTCDGMPLLAIRNGYRYIVLTLKAGLLPSTGAHPIRDMATVSFLQRCVTHRGCSW